MAGVKLLSKKDAEKLVEILAKTYKGSKYYLNFKTHSDLFVAAVLSAHTSADITNSVTPSIFARYKTFKDYANADEKEFGQEIHRILFASAKAKNVIAACKIIVQKYGSKIPRTIEELTELPGIGRKTANNILINAYGIAEGIPVDLWGIRLSYRFGLSSSKNPLKVERDLMNIVDKKHWHNWSYILRNHGYAVCHASNPLCSKCPVNKLCQKNGVTRQL